MKNYMLTKNFSFNELKCKHTGKCNMHPDFLYILQRIRDNYKKPMTISSGYRDKTHPIEINKKFPGEHCYGVAADILCYGEQTLQILKHVLDLNITRIGLSQKNNLESRYIHIGIGDKIYPDRFKPSFWTY